MSNMTCVSAAVEFPHGVIESAIVSIVAKVVERGLPMMEPLLAESVCSKVHGGEP